MNTTAKPMAVPHMRDPVEWRELIDAIEDRIVRVQVACIVWWDYFGKQQARCRWPHLDDYLAEWKWTDNANQAACIAELKKLGYSHYDASQRFSSEYRKGARNSNGYRKYVKAPRNR